MPETARPTSARVREALFSLVGQDLQGVRVLDAFGGSGLVALEAWSRGAAVVSVERDRAAVRAIRANVAALGASVEVIEGDVLDLVARLGMFDLALLDPPYAAPPGPILARLGPSVRDCMALEHPAEVHPPPVEGWVIDRRREYGLSALTVYRQGGA